MKNLSKFDIVYIVIAAAMPVVLFVMHANNYSPIWNGFAMFFIYPIPLIAAIIYAFVTARKRDIMALFPLSMLLVSFVLLFLVSPIYERYEFSVHKADRLAVVSQTKTKEVAPGRYTLPEMYSDISETGDVIVVSNSASVCVAFCLMSLPPDNNNIYIAYRSNANTGDWSDEEYVKRAIDPNWAVVYSGWCGSVHREYTHLVK